MDTITYLLKVNLYWILFYGWYWLMLRNHTFFKMNRFFLVISLMLSLLLPLIEFPETIIAATSVSDNLPRHLPLAAVVQGTDAPISVEIIAFIFYAGIASCLLFKLLNGFYNLSLLIRKGEHLEFENYTLVLLPELSSQTPAIGSFSFFKWLVVSSQDYDRNLDTIIQHETVHIRQFHSFDIIFIEILKILFWFNPVLWFYKYSIREVHEFLADEQAKNRDSYAAFLVSYAQKTSVAFITNQFFNASLLKDRVRMLYRNRTSNRLLPQYLMIVPVIIITVSITAARPTVITRIEPDNGEKMIAASNENITTIKKNSKTDNAGNSENAIAKIMLVNKKRNDNSLLPDTSTTSKKAIGIVETEVHDTTFLQDNHNKMRYTNFHQKLIKVETPNTFFPTLTSINKIVTRSVKYLKDEPPKTQLNFGHYPMTDYSFYRHVKIDTISFH